MFKFVLGPPIYGNPHLFNGEDCYVMTCPTHSNVSAFHKDWKVWFHGPLAHEQDSACI